MPNPCQMSGSEELFGGSGDFHPANEPNPTQPTTECFRPYSQKGANLQNELHPLLQRMKFLIQELLLHICTTIKCNFLRVRNQS